MKSEPLALSLFSGVGLHDLGLYRAGWSIAAQVEIDPWCRAVLAKHWPSVPRWKDVRDVSAHSLRAAGIPAADLVTGGFPCGQTSAAGKGEGIGTEAAPTAVSGLWWEMYRIVRECRPAWVLIENSPALRTRGYEQVADALEAIDYEVRPVVVGARHVGAPHRRLRVWIVGRRVGDAERDGRGGGTQEAGRTAREATPGSSGRRVGDPQGCGCHKGQGRAHEGTGGRGVPGDADRGVAHTDGGELREFEQRLSGGRAGGVRDEGGAEPGRGGARGMAHADSLRLEGIRGGGVPDGGAPFGDDVDGRHRWPAGRGAEQFPWEPPRLEPRLGRGADGGAARLDGFARRNRLRALGNANPPDVPELIGRWMLEQAAQ